MKRMGFVWAMAVLIMKVPLELRSAIAMQLGPGGATSHTVSSTVRTRVIAAAHSDRQSGGGRFDVDIGEVT